MKIKVLLCLFAGALLLQSCHDEATIQVTNKVHNVRLDNVYFSKVQIGSSIITGETVEAKITDYYKEIAFPVTSRLEFYMVKGDKKVYLLTREYYRVDKGEKLKIVIADDTELINPINE